MKYDSYNIPDEGYEPHVSDKHPLGAVEDLKLATQKLAEAHALIFQLKKHNLTLIEALKSYSMMTRLVIPDNWSVSEEGRLPVLDNYYEEDIGETARQALESVSTK